jgi:hypothetical protein
MTTKTPALKYAPKSPATYGDDYKNGWVNTSCLNVIYSRFDKQFVAHNRLFGGIIVNRRGLIYKVLISKGVINDALTR